MFKHIVFTLIYIFLYAADVPINLQYALVVHTAIILYSYFTARKFPDPLAVYALYVMLVSVCNVVMIVKVEKGLVMSYYSYIVPEKLNVASMIWAIGNTAFFVGMEVSKKMSFSPIDQDITQHKKLLFMFRVMLIMSLMKNFILRQVFLGSLSSMLDIFSSMGLIFFSRLWGATGDKQFRKYALILFSLQTVNAVLFSFLRSEMITPLICILMGYMLGQKSIKLLFSPYILPVIVMLFFFNSYFDLFGNQRSELSSGFSRVSEIQTAKIVYDNNVYTEVEKQSVVDRSSVMPQLTSLVNLVDMHGFYNGETIKTLLIAFIPRFLWPEKPIIGLGGWFATEIGQGRQTDTWYSNSINMTIPGHLYLDLEWIGVIIGCILMGIFINCIWNSSAFYSSPYNITGIILGGYLLFLSLNGMGADLQICITLLSYYLIFFVLKKLA
jgi:hypothetical protein